MLFIFPKARRNEALPTIRIRPIAYKQFCCEILLVFLSLLINCNKINIKLATNTTL